MEGESVPAWALQLGQRWLVCSDQLGHQAGGSRMMPGCQDEVLCVCARVCARACVLSLAHACVVASVASD